MAIACDHHILTQVQASHGGLVSKNGIRFFIVLYSVQRLGCNLMGQLPIAAQNLGQWGNCPLQLNIAVILTAV